MDKRHLRKNLHPALDEGRSGGEGQGQGEGRTQKWRDTQFCPVALRLLAWRRLLASATTTLNCFYFPAATKSLACESVQFRLHTL